MSTEIGLVPPSLRELDEASFRDRLDRMNEDVVIEANWDRFCPIYINLLSVFGEKLGAANVRSLAARCTRRSVWSDKAIHFCLGNLHALAKESVTRTSSDSAQQLIRSKGWDPHGVRRLLAAGKGLIVCTFRFGQYSFIPVELALLGFSVLTPLQAGKFGLMHADLEWIRADLRSRGFRDVDNSPGEPKPENIRLFQVLNAEESAAPLRIARVLKKGGVVVIYTDGNSGVDGPWGDDSRSTVRFLNLAVSVKNGVARLASRLQAPILPVLVLGDDSFGQVVLGDPIVVSERLSGSAREEFVQETTQSLYDFLAPYAAQYPEQWEGCSALHRWRFRVLDQEEQAPDRGSEEKRRGEVGRLLEEGAIFKVNQRRGIAELPSKRGLIWVDTKTLKSYRNPDWSKDILRALSDVNGLNQGWIDAQGADPEWKQRIHTLLAYLKNLDLIVVSESQAAVGQVFPQGRA